VLILPEDFNIDNIVWSPDCDRLAFDRHGIGSGTKSLCIYYVATGTYEEVPNVPQNHVLMDWSHDGEWILYYTPGDWKLYIIRPDGSDNTLISPDAIGGSFSPDDREVVFDSGKGLTVADISDLSDIKYRLIDWIPGSDVYARWEGKAWWGPGGPYLARDRSVGDMGNIDEDIKWYVYCINAYEESYEVVLDDQPNWASIRLNGWSPDGRYLLLTIIANGLEELWAYEVKTGEYTQITFGSNTYLHLVSADWGNKGKIAFNIFDFEMYDENHNGPYNVVYSIDAPY
jgi:Tol biopolymer transport system component